MLSDAEIGQTGHFRTGTSYVIEATPKTKAGMGKQVYYYGQDNGMLLQMEVFTADGKPLSTTRLSNLKLNADIDPARFIFKAPEGVTVQEMPGQN